MPIDINAAANTPAESSPAPANENDAFAQALASSTPPAATPAGEATPPASPAVAAGATPAAAPAAATPMFRELFKDSGLNVDDFPDDKAFVAALLNERRQLSQYAQIGQRVAPQMADFDKYLQSQQQAAAAKAATPDPNEWSAEKHFAEAWPVPKRDPQWEWLVKNNLVEIDENGMYQAKPGAEAMAAPHLPAINQHRQAQAEQVQKFLADPYGSTHKALLEPMRREFKAMLAEAMGQERSQAQQQTAIQQFESKYGSLLFDPAGNVTQTGQRLASLAQPLLDKGFPDYEAYQWAADAMGLAAAAAAPPAQAVIPPTPNQVSAQQKDVFIQRALQNTATAPNSAPFLPNSPAPVFTNDAEIDGLFDQAARTLAK